MATVNFTSVIERPAEEIFDLLADIRRNPEWYPGFTRAEMLTAGPVGADSVFRTDMRGMGGLEMHITRYERPSRLRFTATAKQMEVAHSFVFVPGPSGTRLDQEVDVRPKGMLRVSAPLMALTLKRSIQANTAALKVYMERGTSGDALAPRAPGVEAGA